MGTTDDWTTNDPSLYLPPKTTRDPNAVAMAFLGYLYYDDDNAQLTALVTPQSRATWEDFSAARQHVRSLQSPALSTGNTRANGARDVAYVAVVTEVEEGYVTSASTQVDADVFTLVWHEQTDSWLVAGLGPRVPSRKLERPSVRPAPERA